MNVSIANYSAMDITTVPMVQTRESCVTDARRSKTTVRTSASTNLQAPDVNVVLAQF